MESVVDKRLKLDEQFLSDLQSTQPRPIKVTDQVPISSRTDEKALENAKTGKVTAVVTGMHIYGKTKSSLPKASTKNSAKRTKLGSKSRKLGLYCPTMHLKGARWPPEDANERLLGKHKTIRVLLDTGSSGDLLFLENGSNKCLPIVNRADPESWSTSNGTFLTKKVGDVKLSFMEYSTRKKGHLRLDIVEYPQGSTPPLYNLIIGKQTLHDIGAMLDLKEKTITIDKILLHMKLKPSISRALKQNSCRSQ
jgi:hypothetical protein